jgi:hypothetical protein
LNLSGNRLCGAWFDNDEYGRDCVTGTFNAEGITAVADALRVNCTLKQVLAF